MSEYTELSLKDIVLPKNLIREIEGQAVYDLKESIKKHGVLQPILVRPIPNNKYEVVFGCHRLIASKGVELKTIPAKIMYLNDLDAAILSISENIQRLELNPLREGELYTSIIKTHFKKGGRGRGIKELSDYLGKSIHYLSRRITLYEKLDPKLKPKLGDTLPIDVAIKLCKLPMTAQREFFNKIEKNRVELESQYKSRNLIGGCGSGLSEKCICPKCGNKHENGNLIIK